MGAGAPDVSPTCYRLYSEIKGGGYRTLKRDEVTAPKLFAPTSVAGYAGPSFFLTDSDHTRNPDTTIRGSEWGPASVWPHKGGCAEKSEDPNSVLGG